MFLLVFTIDRVWKAVWGRGGGRAGRGPAQHFDSVP